MKLHVFSKTLFLAALAFFSFATVNAQSDAAPVGKAKMSEKKQHHDDQIAKDLNLSEDQKARFKKIDDEYAAKAKEKRSAKKEEMARMREEKIKAHKAVLSPEQAAKYDEIMAKKQAKKETRKKKKTEKKSEMKDKKMEKKAEKKAIKEELNKQ